MPTPRNLAPGTRRWRPHRHACCATLRSAVLLLTVGVALGMLGCSVARRGQQALSPLLQAPPTASRPLEHPRVDATAQRLLEARRQAGRLRAGRNPQNRRLMSPLAAEGTEWEASSLTWAVLRQSGALLPLSWPAIPRSTEALQAWLRQELALGRHRSTELWLVQTRAGTPAEVELLIVHVDDVWRSGTELLDVPAAERRSWVLTPEETPPTARSRSLESPSAMYLRERSGTVWLESREGLEELQLRGEEIQPHGRLAWDEWDLTWAERHLERGQTTPPGLALLSGDARLELRLSEAAPTGHQQWGWAVARAQATALLPLGRTAATRITSIQAAPWAWGRRDAWLTLESGAEGERGEHLALYSAPLRALPETPMWAAPSDTRAVRQAIPVQPITVAPVAPTGLRGAALEDPWLAWRLVQCGVRLFRPQAPRTAEPGVRLAASEQGRRWELRLPQPGARAGRPAIHAADWERALRTAMSDPLAVEGRRPQDDWLLGPLLGAQLESTRDGVRITFRQPVPDLPERLAHPRLALQDTVIASRFASHRFAGPRRLDLLLPRHPGAVPLQLIPTRDPVEARARFVRGQDALLRPFDLALDDSMARAGVAAAAAGHRTVAETPFGIAVLERPTCMAVILDPAAQAPLRRDLARRLRRFTPRDLLAVEDSTLRPLPPAGVVGMEALMADGANAPLAPGALRGVVLEMSVDALPEAHRAADRIAVLLQAEGVQTTLVDRVALGSVPLPTGQTPSSGGNADRRVRARLTRVPLFAHDPLLRALELRARVLPGLDLPEDLRLAAQLDPAASDRRRSETAAQIELELLAEGLVVPLWTQPGLVLCDRRLGDAGAADVDQPQVTSLPLLLQAARWYDDPAPR